MAELEDLRRMFHKNPEIGFTEFWTTARICKYLDDLKYKDLILLYGKQLYDNFSHPELLQRWDNKVYESVQEQHKNDETTNEWINKLNGRTGLVAIIKGKQEGPKVGFRFDIDGLPIEESNEDFHLPFKEGFSSINKNMHACGHDGHITIGLGLAKMLIENAEKLKGTFYLMFQPAEELLLGGKIFSQLSLTKELNYFFPVHIGLIGERKIICGLSFLAAKRYHVLFKGRSSHAGVSPEKGKNALLAACNAVNSLYSISRHSGGCSRINVGEFTSKNASNIIPDKAQFELDLRGETNEICDYLKHQALNIINGVSKMYDVENEIKFMADAETAINSSDLISLVHRVCLEVGVEENSIIDNYLVPGSEDAIFIMNEVLKNMGLSTYIGIGSPTFGGHHNEKFDFEEGILLEGVNILYKIAVKISDEHT